MPLVGPPLRLNFGRTTACWYLRLRLAGAVYRSLPPLPYTVLATRDRTCVAAFAAMVVPHRSGYAPSRRCSEWSDSRANDVASHRASKVSIAACTLPVALKPPAPVKKHNGSLTYSASPWQIAWQQSGNSKYCLTLNQSRGRPCTVVKLYQRQPLTSSSPDSDLDSYSYH